MVLYRHASEVKEKEIGQITGVRRWAVWEVFMEFWNFCNLNIDKKCCDLKRQEQMVYIKRDGEEGFHKGQGPHNKEVQVP